MIVSTFKVLKWREILIFLVQSSHSRGNKLAAWFHISCFSQILMASKRQIGHGFGVHGLGSTAHPMISNESPGQTWLILVYLGLAQHFLGGHKWQCVTLRPKKISPTSVPKSEILPCGANSRMGLA